MDIRFEQDRTTVAMCLAMAGVLVLFFVLLVSVDLSTTTQRLLTLGLIADVVGIVCVIGYHLNVQRIETTEKASYPKPDLEPVLTLLSTLASDAGSRVALVDQAITRRPGCLSHSGIQQLNTARRIIDKLNERSETLVRLIQEDTLDAYKRADQLREEPLHFPPDHMSSVSSVPIPDLPQDQWREVLETLLASIEESSGSEKKIA